MVRLILASASPARLQTLRAAGIEPTVRISGVDEEVALAAAADSDTDAEPPTPADVTLILAQAKAEAVAASAEESALVLGCDSILELDGEVHGKPVDANDAVERWRTMRGRAGTLHSGHWLIDARDPDEGGSAGTVGATAATAVHFAELTDAEIDAYVATGEPLNVAGAFTIDGLGGPFVSRIEGDHHTVVGLSLPLLRGLLTEVDLSVTDLWRQPDLPA